MSLKRRNVLPLGTISEGTLKSDDIIGALLDASDLLVLPRKDREEVRRIRRRMEHRSELISLSDETMQDQDDDRETLDGILSGYVPEYTYLGAHPGDGALIGVWADDDAIEMAIHDGELEKSEDTPPGGMLVCGGDPPRSFPRYWLTVNDHGNMTLYRRAGGRWKEVWSVV